MPAGAGQRVSLDGEWRFWVDTQNHVPIQVPFTNEPRETLTTYQKLFTVPPGACDGLVLLRFDGVVGTATVYLNGVELGQHGPYTPFWFPVSSLLNVGGENDLVVTIDDRLDTTTVPHWAVTWVNYSGIMRSVYLECADQAVLLSTAPQYDLSDELTHVEGEVHVQAAGAPGTEISFVGALLDGVPDNWTTVALLDPVAGVPVGADGLASAALSFSADGLELWSPDSPKLYYLYVIAQVDGQPADERLIQTGFRDIRVDGNDILLNGQPLLLKGTSRHDIYPPNGFIGTEQQMIDDMAAIKAAGLNYVRLIHYPHHPRILELADQVGLLVSEELPAWVDFWNEDIHVRLYAMFEELFHRDGHHPSLFLWITGTSPLRPMPYGLEATQVVKGLDRTRLVSLVIDDCACDQQTLMEDANFCYAAGLDLMMKNAYWGAYQYVETVRGIWPRLPKDIPVVIAEFGQEGSDSGPLYTNGTNDVWIFEDQQAAFLRSMLEAWRIHLPQHDADDHLSGLVLFNYQDIPWPDMPLHWEAHHEDLHFGLVRQDRTLKPAYQTCNTSAVCN